MAITVTPLDAKVLNNGFSAGTKTFTGLNGGSTFPAGKVVIILDHDQADTDPADFVVGSGGGTVALTAVVDDGTRKVRKYYADVPAGTVDEVSFTNGAAYNLIGVGGHHLAGAANGAPTATAVLAYGATGTDLHTLGALTVAAGGALTAGFGSLNAAISTTQLTTWGNVVNTTGDDINRINPGLIIGYAHNVTAGSQVVTVEGTGADSFASIGGAVAAVWAPAAGAAPVSTPHKRFLGRFH